MKVRRVARLKLPRRVPRLRALFAICVDNSEYLASLERWKIYRVLPDRDAERHGQLRVVDESGEDYLFSAAYFQLVELPSLLRRLYRATAA